MTMFSPLRLTPINRPPSNSSNNKHSVTTPINNSVRKPPHVVGNLSSNALQPDTPPAWASPFSPGVAKKKKKNSFHVYQPYIQDEEEEKDNDSDVPDLRLRQAKKQKTGGGVVSSSYTANDSTNKKRAATLVEINSPRLFDVPVTTIRPREKETTSASPRLFTIAKQQLELGSSNSSSSVAYHNSKHEYKAEEELVRNKDPLSVEENEVVSNLLSRIWTNESPDLEPEVIGLEEQQRQITGILTEALKETTPTSRSFLLVGDRGSGRNHVLKCVLRQLAVTTGEFKILRINGLAHKDDTSALRELTKQLANATLNQLLQQNEELETDEEEDNDGDSSEFEKDEAAILQLQKKKTKNATSKFFQNLKFLVDTLMEENAKHRARYLVVLEDFDSFARVSKQSFLYSLLDFSHRAELGGFVLCGITSRLDVLNLMEKRVKSRFDNTQILFPPITKHMDLIRILRQRLFISPQTKDLEKLKVISKWNESLNQVVQEEKFLKVLKKISEMGFSTLFLIQFAYHAVRKCKSNNFAYLKVSDFTHSFRLLVGNTTNEIVKALPRCELLLLVAMVYLEREKKINGYSFQAVYDSCLLQDAQNYGYNVAWKAFENLRALRLVEVVSYSVLVSDEEEQKKQRARRSKYCPKEFVYYKLNLLDVEGSLLDPIIHGDVKLLNNLKQKCILLKSQNENF